MNTITKNAIFGLFMIPFLFNTSYAEEKKLDSVLALVNGHEIKLSEVIIAVGKLPKDYDSMDDEYLFNGVLDQLIKQEIMSQKFDDTNSKSLILLEQEIRSIRAKYAIEALMAGFPTEEQVQTMYQQISLSNSDNEEYNASHILVPSKDEAEEIIDMLANGVNFSTLAKERSTGPSGPNGGSLGWFGPGQMVPEFEAAVIVLEVGNVSQPVQTQFGWHVVKLNDRRKIEIPPLEDMKPKIIQDLNQKRLAEIIDDAMSASSIEIKPLDEDLSIIRRTDLIK